MADRIQQRRDTATRWAQYNPVLLEGEVGYVTDNPNQYKIGDGIHAWNNLPLRGYTGTIVQDTGDDENAVMSQKVTTDKLTRLEYPYFKYSGSATINSGQSVKHIYVSNSLYAKGKIKFIIDKSNFPQDIKYLGCQIRDSKHEEITTNASEVFLIDAFDSEGHFTVSFYFNGTVQSDIVIPFIVESLYGSPYEEGTRELIKDVEQKMIVNDIASLSTMKSYAYNKAVIEVGKTISNTIYLGLKAQKGDIVRIKVISRNYQTEDIKGIQYVDSSPEELMTSVSDEHLFVVKNNTSFIQANLYLKNAAVSKKYVEFISEIVNINNNEIYNYLFTWGFIKTGNTLGGYEKINFPLKKGNKYILSLISKEIPDNEFLGLQIRNQYDEEIITTRGIAVLNISKDSSYFSVIAYSKVNVESKKRFHFRLISIPNGVNELNLDANLEPYSRLLSEYNLKLEPRKYGIFENFLDYKIIGAGKYLTSIADDKGNYYAPPIEIAGGAIQNLSVLQTGGKTEQSGYCIHTDNDQNKNKTLYINNCILKSNSNSCIGCGTREGYNIIIDNCIFVYEGTNENSDANCWYSHNTTQSVNPDQENPSKISFINCILIKRGKGAVMRIQDWNGTTDKCVFTFINNTFLPSYGNVEDCVQIEYRNYNGSEIGIKEFKNKLSLSPESCGNNVSWLNS